MEANQNQNLDYDEEEVEDVEDRVVIEHVFKGNVADSNMRDSVEQKEADTVRQAMDSGNCDVVEEEAGNDTVVEGEVQGEDKRLVKLTGERPCIICNKKDKHPKRHSLAEHLPWFTAPCNKQEIQMGRLNFHAREHHHIKETRKLNAPVSTLSTSTPSPPHTLQFTTLTFGLVLRNVEGYNAKKTS